jgi:hypothetical protein
MATALQQAAFRAKDTKTLVQIRLAPETVERLDQMVRDQGASGRAEIIEALLAGETPRPPAPMPRTGQPRLTADGLHWI